MSKLDDLAKRTQEGSTSERPPNSLDDNVPPKNHAARVAAFTIAIARQMGLPKGEIDVIARGAYLQDIGKLAIDHAILLKPGALTPEETVRMREHCLLGYKMLKNIPHLAGADEIVYSHHENYDGTGYPRGLKGEQIPSGARIVAVANTLDSITTNLPYRTAQSLDAAQAETQRCSGHQFDPGIVKIFLRIPDKIWTDIMQSLHRQPPA